MSCGSSNMGGPVFAGIFGRLATGQYFVFITTPTEVPARRTAAVRNARQMDSSELGLRTRR
jgi:hypothetical protein